MDITVEDLEIIQTVLTASNKVILKSQRALELMWKGLTINSMDVEDFGCITLYDHSCPYDEDNKYFKEARILCKELGVKGYYSYNGEFHGN